MFDLPKRSLGDVLSLRHPNNFVLAGANNRNVIITYRFLAAPVQANRDFFYIDCITVYFTCKYFPQYTRELLECLLGISPSGRNPCRGKKFCQSICSGCEQWKNDWHNRALNAWLLQASNLLPVYSFWIRLMANRRNGLGGMRNFELNLTSTSWGKKKMIDFLIVVM